MLYLGNVLLRYVLIHNLDISFNFHVKFLQLNVRQKLFFSLLSAIFFKLPITRTFFELSRRSRLCKAMFR